jgi:hypothetical protein
MMIVKSKGLRVKAIRADDQTEVPVTFGHKSGRNERA